MNAYILSRTTLIFKTRRLAIKSWDRESREANYIAYRSKRT